MQHSFHSVSESLRLEELKNILQSEHR